METKAVAATEPLLELKQPGLKPVTVRQFGAAMASAWDSFVQAQPTGTPFHSTAWMRALEKSFGYEPRSLVAERGGELLAAFSYRGVLARGFALVRDAKGRPLRTAAAITAGMPLDIEFADGRIGARAETPSGVERVPTSSSKTRGSRAGGSGQGDLF